MVTRSKIIEQLKEDLKERESALQESIAWGDISAQLAKAELLKRKATIQVFEAMTNDEFKVMRQRYHKTNAYTSAGLF